MFLAGHTVSMVTYCVTKMIITCSPMIGQFFFYRCSINSLIKSDDYDDPSKSKSWKGLETVLNHLKVKGRSRSLDRQMMRINSL